MHVTELARLEQIQVLELVETGPEVIAVEHRTHVWMSGGARHLQQRRQRGDERRRAYELGHRRHVELSGDFSDFAHAVGNRFVVLGGDLLLWRSGRRVNALQTQRCEHLAALLQRVERGRSVRILFPQSLQRAAVARYRRQSEVGEQPVRCRQRFGLQELVEKIPGDLDLPDARARPAFERLPEARSRRRVLMDRERHLRRRGRRAARRSQRDRRQKHRSSGQHEPCFRSNAT